MLEKSGQDSIIDFARVGKFILYSDSRKTQVFEFDTEELEVRKATSLVTGKNDLQELPAV